VGAEVGYGFSPVFTINTAWQEWQGAPGGATYAFGVSNVFSIDTAFAETTGAGESNVFTIDTRMASVALVGDPAFVWASATRLQISATVFNRANCAIDVWLGASLMRIVDGQTVYYDDPPRDIHFLVPPGESTIVRWFHVDEAYSSSPGHEGERLPDGAAFDLVTRLYEDAVPISEMTTAGLGALTVYVKDQSGSVPAFAESRLLVQRYDRDWAFIDERAADSLGRASYSEDEVTPDATYGYQAYYERPNPFESPAVGEFWSEVVAVAHSATHLIEMPRNLPYVNEAQFLVDGEPVSLEAPAGVGDSVVPRLWLTHGLTMDRSVSVRLLLTRDYVTRVHDMTRTLDIPLGACVSVDFPAFTPDAAGTWYAAWKVTDASSGKTDCCDWTAVFAAEAGPQTYTYWTTRRQVGCTPFAVTGRGKGDWDTDFSAEAVDYQRGARLNLNHLTDPGGNATYRFTLPATDLVTYTRITVRVRGRAAAGAGAPALELGAVGRDWAGVGAAEGTYPYVIEAPDDPATFLAPGPESYLATFDVVVKPGAWDTYLVEWLEVEVEGTYTNPLLESVLFVNALEKALAEAEAVMALWDFGGSHEDFEAAAARGVAILGKWLQEAAPGPEAASGTGLPIDDVIFGARDTLQAMILTARVVQDTWTYMDEVGSLLTEALERQEYETGLRGQDYDQPNRVPSAIAADMAEARVSLSSLTTALLAAGSDGVLAPEEAGGLAAAGADLATAISRLQTVKDGMTDFGRGMCNFLHDKTTKDDLETVSTYRGALDAFGNLVQYDYRTEVRELGTPQEYVQYTHHDATPVADKSYLWVAKDTLFDLRARLQSESSPITRWITGHVTEGVSGLSDVRVALNVNGADQQATTNYSGYYSAAVDHGATVTIEFERAGFAFTPATIDLGAVITDRGSVNSEGTRIDCTVSGRVTAAGAGIGGVTIDGLPGTVVTAADGTYSATVDYGWNGMLQPQSAGITFNPAYRLTGTVTADLGSLDFAAADDELEPNNGIEQAAPLDGGTHQDLVCLDPDCYALTVPAFSDLDLTAIVSAGDSDLALALFDPAGASLGEATSVNGFAVILYDWTEAGTYTVRVRSPSGAPVPYNLELTVTDSAPRVTTQPQDQTVTYGDAVSFTVGAQGRGLSYAWQRNGQDLGVTAPELYLEAAVVADSGAYRCVVSNAAGSAPSDAATLTVSKASATVTLQELSQTYDGTPRAVTATTVPEGLAVDITYDGAAEAPVAAGTYEVTGTVVDANYAASATDTLTVAKASQTIDFPNPGDKNYTDTFALSATGGDSGNPVTFAKTSGPAVIGAGNVVSFTGLGAVTITASQAGNANYQPASDVARTFTVLDDTTPSAPVDSDPADDTVAEGAANGAAVGVTASSTDVPTSTLTYSLTDDAEGRFTVNAETGLVTVANGALLDYERNTEHQVTVRAADPSGNASTALFTILVADVNEPPSVALANTTTELAENTAAQTKVADIVVTDDALGDEALSLGGADSALFEIAGAELFLKAGQTVDFETNPVLEVRVEVNDATVGDKPDDSAALQVAVTDENDAPTAAADAAGTTENASVTKDVIANDTDPDATDALSLVEGSAAIDSMTLDGDGSAIAVVSASVSQAGDEITFHPGADFELLATGQTATVVIDYRVTDDDAAPLTDSGTLIVTVAGTNDAPLLDLDADTEGTDRAVAFIEDSGAVAVADVEGLSVTDVDDTRLEAATVRLTARLDGPAEWLSADAGQTGIVISPASGAGVLSLSGDATHADYEAVLRTVTYNNTSPVPNTTDRVIEFTVNDGDNDSRAALAVVCFLDTVQLVFHPKLNLLSLPFDTGGRATPETVLVDASGKPLFAGDIATWDAEAKGYKVITGAIAGKTVFWAYSPCPRRDVRTTAPIQGAFKNGTVSLRHAWNMVGPVIDIALRDIPGRGGAGLTFWYWDAELQVYRPVRAGGLLERGRGYWVYVGSEDGCVIQLRP